MSMSGSETRYVPLKFPFASAIGLPSTKPRSFSVCGSSWIFTATISPGWKPRPDMTAVSPG
jgi:hypothetical protein